MIPQGGTECFLIWTLAIFKFIGSGGPAADVDLDFNHVQSPNLVSLEKFNLINFRYMDNWRGTRCDGELNMQAFNYGGHKIPGRASTEPFYSKSDSYYVFGERAGVKTLEQFGTEAAFGVSFYEAEGQTHFIYVKRNLKLQEVKPSDGSINPTGLQTLTDITYEISSPYSWKDNRNLKSQDQILGTPDYFPDSQNVYKSRLISVMNEMYNNLNTHDTSSESIDKLHKYGIQQAAPIMAALDYDTLKSVYAELQRQGAGSVAKRNLFVEFLSSTGTTPAAMLILDSIRQGSFDGYNSARAFVSIPYHIVNPNMQLVKEMESVLGSTNDETLKQGGPLALAHMVRRTCERGANEDFGNPEWRSCIAQFSNKYADKFFEDFKKATNDKDRLKALTVLYNLRWGKVHNLVTPIINDKSYSDSVRTMALTVGMWGTFIDKSTVAYTLPIFMDSFNGHELRIAALSIMTYARELDITQLSVAVMKLYAEQNEEVKNFAYTLFETKAGIIDPCEQKANEKFKSLLKFMKQAGAKSGDYGIGLSKVWRQEFTNDKYGYGGANELYVIGSEHSIAPLSIGLNVIHTYHNGYKTYPLDVSLRIQGLSKVILEKFKGVDKRKWKLDDLSQILTDLNIPLKQEQPLKLSAIIKLKGDIIFYKSYDTETGDKLTDILKDIQGAKGPNTYEVDHQRALSFGTMLYEQPSETGLPIGYASTTTTMLSIKAKVKKGISRGLLFRDITFDVNMNSQSGSLLSFMVPGLKTKVSIVQDKVYALHIPRRLKAGINLVKKELLLDVETPTFDNPMHIIMHGETFVGIAPTSLTGETQLSKSCPSCMSKYIISKNQKFAKSKTITNTVDKDFGSIVKGEYFDCELPLSDSSLGSMANTLFSPWNKNPQTPLSSLMMSLRQARMFLFSYPNVEKCGAYIKWSRTQENPVTSIEVRIQGKNDKNGRKYMYDGSKFLMKSTVILKGEPVKREFKFNMIVDSSPGMVSNEIKTQFLRKEAPALGLSNYTVCFSAKNKFPELPTEFMGGSLDDQLELSGEMQFKYGATQSCAQAGGSIKVDFKHGTTQEGKNALKGKDYYKTCMADKASPAWKHRSGLPITDACWMTGVDASMARKYMWDTKFEHMTNEIENGLNKVFTGFKAFMLPFWSSDQQSVGDLSKTNPKLKIDVLYKDSDKLVDVGLTTDKGHNSMKDIDTSNMNIFLGGMRNLRYDMFSASLVQNNLLGNFFSI